jgi:hypothetical protein
MREYPVPESAFLARDLIISTSTDHEPAFAQVEILERNKARLPRLPGLGSGSLESRAFEGPSSCTAAETGIDKHHDQFRLLYPLEQFWQLSLHVDTCSKEIVLFGIVHHKVTCRVVWPHSRLRTAVTGEIEHYHIVRTCYSGQPIADFNHYVPLSRRLVQ